MRTTIMKDDALFDEASRLSDPREGKSELIRQCMLSFIHLQTARRLAVRCGV